MPENISGLKFCKGSTLRTLRPVLQEWIKVVEEYSMAFKNDACWWYNERANVGILAAAAWRTAGWLSLEEYSTTKHGEKGVSKNGRSDLYVGKANHKTNFAIEAKAAWQDIGGNNTGQISKQIDLAWRDAGNLLKDAAEKRVAACFVMPRINSKKMNDNDVTKRLEDWLVCVKADVPYDALAWVFPVQSRNLINNNNHFFPGVVLLLRARFRANRK